MRRRTGGLWLPALVLTALAVIGVVVLLAIGAPVVPRSLPFLVVDDEDPGPRSVKVSPSPSQTPSPSPTPSVTRTPTAVPTTIGPSVRPTVRPTTRPTSVGPSRPPATKKPSTSPSPTTPKCAGGSVTVAADADTYVDQASPNQNFGSAGNLLVTSRDRERNRRVLVRFPMPLIPAGCTLRTATLTMTAKDTTGRQLIATRAAKPWSEANVTWANAPAPSGSTSAAATVTQAKVQWSVTSLVSAMRSSGNYGFLVRDAAEGARGAGEQTNLHPRTSSARPTLFLRWS